MKPFRLVASIAFAMMLGAWACNAIAATATGSLSYDFTTDPPCSTTVTIDCIDHFTLFDVTNSPNNVSLTTIVPPNTVNQTGVTTVPFNFKVGAPYGNRKWAAQAVAKNGAGAMVGSDITAPQAQSTVTVKPGAPAAFVVNLQ